MRLFRTLVFDVVKKDVTNAIIDLVNEERAGIAIDRSLVRACVELYESMGVGTLEVYLADFEAPLLQSTREFYARKADAWIQENTTPDYLIKVEQALEEERQRVLGYLAVDSESRLLRVVEEETLEKKLTELLEKEGSGCRVLVANDRGADLARMFRLLSRLPDGLSPMADILKSHIISLGNDKIDQRATRLDAQSEKEREKESGQDPQLVKDLLALHDKYLEVVNTHFVCNALFQKALKDAFVEIVNRDVGKYKNADLMSSFCDRILKTGGEKLSDSEVEEYLEKVVQLFSYLTDKDLFAEIYRNQLAKRLLNQRSNSDELERLMIGKLKLRCGAQFTGKMEGMLNDLAIGVDHQSDFNKHMKEAGADLGLGRTEFSVQILTTGYWPTYKPVELTLPPVMQKCVQVFKAYYDTKVSHRRLQWQHTLGNASVKATYGSKVYELVLTTLQAVVLLAFNPSESGGSSAGPVSFDLEELGAQVGLQEEHLKRVLHSLACGKFKVVKKDGNAQQIKSTDKFTVNKSFSCPQRKIRIPMATIEESHNPKKVEEDRSVAIDAAIVRIMKARKTLTHQQLVAETLTQLSFFKPDPKVVKRRLETLIDREYLARDEENSNLYKYLA